MHPLRQLELENERLRAALTEARDLWWRARNHYVSPDERHDAWEELGEVLEIVVTFGGREDRAG